jgi:hypothetical protein
MSALTGPGVRGSKCLGGSYAPAGLPDPGPVNALTVYTRPEAA